MKITIIGGSQGTGAQLASLAHQAGHEVTAVSRRGLSPDGVRAIAGDARDPAVAAQAVAGADAVVITVGGAAGSPGHRTAVTQSLLKAMQDAGVRRVVVQSTLGAGDSAAQLPAPMRLMTRIALAKPLADHNGQEQAVRGFGLDWSIVRPAGLTNKPPTHNWRVLQAAESGKVYGSIPRGDLAACLLGIVQDDATIGKSLSLGNG